MNKALNTLDLRGASQIAFAGYIDPIIMGECKVTVTPLPAHSSGGSDMKGFVPNAYGPDVHQNQYGQGGILRPQGGGNPN